MTTGAIESEFKPAWWLPGGHSQTLWRKFSSAKLVEHVRQRVELDDGDFIDLDWTTIDPKKSKDNTIVLLLHGLCGCSKSSYILAMQNLLNEQGIASVAMNFRGCSGELNRLARAYHSGVSEDVNEIFQKLLIEFPDQNFMFVGYSLGANVLLKWLGETGAHSRIRKAVAVSTPFALEYCSQAMLKGVSRVYGQYFVRRLVKDFRMKQQYLLLHAPQEAARIAKLGDTNGIASIWDFDDRITAALHGFDGAKDYYRRCSSLGFLRSIAVQTLLIQSKNDPLIPGKSIPQADMLSPSTCLQLTDKGGHVGFVSSHPGNWLEQRILNFMWL
ncbi:MAG: hydrolase [Pseudohongiellaceae bacterium]